MSNYSFKLAACVCVCVPTWSLSVHCSVQISVIRFLACLAISSRNMLHNDRLRSPMWWRCGGRRVKTHKGKTDKGNSEMHVILQCKNIKWNNNKFNSNLRFQRTKWDLKLKFVFPLTASLDSYYFSTHTHNHTQYTVYFNITILLFMYVFLFHTLAI